MARTQAKYKHPGGVIAIPRQVVRSPAYKDLKSNARSLMIELQYVWRPAEPYIHYSVRRAAKELNISMGSAQNAFKQLMDHGFIRCHEESDWFNGKAREWFLTWIPINGREPPNDFLSWQEK